MGITFGWILIIVFVSSGPRSVSGSVIKTGTFQTLQKHPKLKQCTLRFLYENEYFGCRVSEQTDQCQGLTYTWGLNQTTEQGYAYAKKLSVEEDYQPPSRLVRSDDGGAHGWKIPVVLDTGSKIDIFMSIPNWDLIDHQNEIFTLKLLNGSNAFDWTRNHVLKFRMSKGYTYMQYALGTGTGINHLGHTNGTLLSSLVNPKERFQISLLAQHNAITMLVEDKEILTLKLSTHIRMMRYLFASRKYSSSDPIIVHGIKFTGVLE